MVRAPQSLAVLRCWGHQKGDDEPATGNCRTDQAAREAAQNRQPATIAPVTPSLQNPTYVAAEDRWVKTEGAVQHLQGWWILPDERLFLLAALDPHALGEQHSTAHLGKTGLEELLVKHFYIARLTTLCTSVMDHWVTCAKHNPKIGPTLPPRATMHRDGTL